MVKQSHKKPQRNQQPSNSVDDSKPPATSVAPPATNPPSSSSSSSSNFLVILACLFLAGVEVYQLFELLSSRNFALDPEFWDQSWVIVKKNWQSKLIAVMFFLKTLYTPAQATVTVPSTGRKD